MSFLENVEQLIKTNSTRGLVHLEKYYGVSLSLHRQAKDVRSEVYGTAGGDHYNHERDFIGITVGDDFFAAGGGNTGPFKEGWLFTRDSDILPTDIIKINRKDEKIFKYKVTEIHDLGLTTCIFKKYRLASLD